MLFCAPEVLPGRVNCQTAGPRGGLRSVFEKQRKEVVVNGLLTFDFVPHFEGFLDREDIQGNFFGRQVVAEVVVRGMTVLLKNHEGTGDKYETGLSS